MRKQYFLSMLLMAASLSGMAQIPTLEAYVPFDGDVNYAAGNALGITVVNNGATFTTDRNGNPNSALLLDGTTYVNYGNPTNFQFGWDDFTVAVWMKGDPTQVGQGIVVGKRAFESSLDRAYMLAWTASSQQLMAYYRDDDNAANVWPTPSLAANEWHHVAMVFDREAQQLRVYIDAVLVSTESLAGIFTFNANGQLAGELQVGRSSQGAQHFKGSVDDLYIFRGALSATDIAYIMNFVCVVDIPDATLKAALVNNASVNTNQDGEIQCSEAVAYTGSLSITNSTISDITGLEAFTNATGLNLAGNNITSADLSANSALTSIILTNNPLSTVQLPASTSLFACANCDLTALDVSGLPDLTILGFVQNDVTSIDLSNNPLLRELSCSDNQLTALNTANNTLLEFVSAFNNQITSLDFSNNPVLVHIDISDNQLTSLNIANGNNQNLTFYDFFGNPNLSCIQVDDAAWSNANMSVPPGAIYSENCLTVSVDENLASEFKLFPNPTNGIVQFSTAVSGQLMDVTGKAVLGFSRAITINLHEFNPGIYMLRTEGGTVHRVVRQ
jgi:hypothetical protein